MTAGELVEIVFREFDYLGEGLSTPQESRRRIMKIILQRETEKVK